MNYLKPEQFKAGMKVTCKIRNEEISDAKLQSNEYNSSWYICQNIADGMECSNKLDYKYSWIICDGSEINLRNSEIDNLKPFVDLKDKIKSILRQIK